MSLVEKLRNQKRKVYSTFKVEFEDGSAEVLDIVHANVADRQSVLDAAHKAGEMAKLNSAQENVAPDAATALAMQSFYARIACRLLHKDNQRLFQDSQLEDVMLIPGFDSMYEQLSSAFNGSPMGKAAGQGQEEKNEG